MEQHPSLRSVPSNRWVLADCPNTGEEVVGSGWQKEISVLDAQAMWWYCPACGGWHVQQSGCSNNAHSDTKHKH